MRSFAGQPAAVTAAVTALLLALAGPARADGPPHRGAAHDPTAQRLSDLERKLERSLRVIEQLSKKLEQLEAGAPQAVTGSPGDGAKVEQRAAAAAASASTAPLEARVGELEQQLSAISNRSTADDGLPLHGFADVGLRFSDRSSRRGAALGNLNFYLAPQFSTNVKSLVELVFEMGDDGELSTDLERLQIGYTFNDQLTLWLGRFHTPYGYLNAACHHGEQIQSAVLRPRFLEFEDKGGILPSHAVGLWGTGRISLGSGKLNYDGYVVNSPSIALDDPAQPGTGVLNPNLAGSTNHSAMAGARIGYDFSGALQGLTLGVHAFGMTVGDDAASRTSTRVRMAGAWGTYFENNWEVLAEYYGFANRNVEGGTGTHRSWAGFVQAGRTFGRWTPYGRVERASIDQGDNYFAQQSSGQSYGRAAIGMRFDLDPKSALKLEINRTRYTDRGAETVNEARAQYAVRF